MDFAETENALIAAENTLTAARAAQRDAVQQHEKAHRAYRDATDEGRTAAWDANAASQFARDAADEAVALAEARLAAARLAHDAAFDRLIEEAQRRATWR